MCHKSYWSALWCVSRRLWILHHQKLSSGFKNCTKASGLACLVSKDPLVTRRHWAFSDGRNISFVNSDCEKRFTIAFGVTNFSDADKTLCADHPSANVFPRTAVGKLHSLSIKYARRCMPVRTAWAISGSENKVKLSSAFLIAFERSSRSDDQRAPRIEQNLIWKHLRTTIC